jgi:exodeoxyribonuclease V beta subunit
MKELDHINIPLSGINLVEASAGTGKTFAIACLYLRLLVEANLAPEQILVVTYTEAATEELRGRIRRRIREALEVFEAEVSDDQFLLRLSANENGRGPGRDESVRRLDLALKSFDTASIFTIHGFCLRALQDNAFESGALYDTELVTDQAGLLQEVVDDFWRKRFFTRPAPLLGYAVRNGWTPEKLHRFVGGILNSPETSVIPSFKPAEILELDALCGRNFGAVAECWNSDRDEIERILLTDKGLSRSADNYRADCILPLLNEMDAFIGRGDPCDLFSGFDKFCFATMSDRRLKKFSPPEHRFFTLCDHLLCSVQKRFLALKWELVEFVRKQLPQRKHRLNVRFFDDLLSDLHSALSGDSGNALAESLGRRFPAALIDEFQDTDPLQYDIFRKIFDRSRSPLFLIGDPKQAIYSFRGADIFAYLQAAADIEEERRFTLTGNWRSDPALLRALNKLFGNRKHPFVFPEIEYHPVHSGKQKDAEELLRKEGDPPLQVWLLPSGDSGTISGGEASRAAADAVAEEIFRLLSARASGVECGISPGDIAVIVRTHRQAVCIHEALTGRGIPGVMRSDRSIFSTEEAKEVALLVAAMADPGSERKVLAALVTDLLGVTGDELALLLEDQQGWERRLDKFASYHRIWGERGFMAASRVLLAGEGVRGRLLRKPDGERRVTNLLHCLELLHRASHDHGYGVEGLRAWYAEKLALAEETEEYQLRLETDDRAVKILTVHVSKGLEFPVVFCPFMWGGTKERGEVVSFHEDYRLVKDFGSPRYEGNRAAARRETLAESMRLLYVALTRAKHRCYIVAGAVHERGATVESPLSYLFPPRPNAAEDPEVAECRREPDELGLLDLSAVSGGAVSVREMTRTEAPVCLAPAGSEHRALRCREFSGRIPADWRVASFTSFSRGESESAEFPDRDETAGYSGETGVIDDKPAGKSIFTFPRGARAGIFLHELLQDLDFSAIDENDVGKEVERGLDRYGYDREWNQAIMSMLGNVAKVAISTPEGSFSLSDIQMGERLTELEFFFPLRFVTSETLRNTIERWGGARFGGELLHALQTLRFQPVRGMVRGFVDLFFRHGGRYYLADWKSNHLGYRPENYSGERLAEEMARKHYILQYFLYTVALNRYLTVRVPGYRYETHFGGVLYVFVRGVEPARGETCGIFRDKPPAALIEELTQLLLDFGGMESPTGPATERSCGPGFRGD